MSRIDATHHPRPSRDAGAVVTAGVRVREFHDDDLDGVVRLFAQASGSDAPPVYALSEVIASCQKDHAVVAVERDRIVGAAVGRAAHAQGWVVFFAVDRDAEDPVLDADLLDALQRRMAPLGLGKLSVLVPDQGDSLSTFTDIGFRVRRQLRYLERPMPIERRELDLLREVGGRLVPPGGWERLSGMVEEKALLEERLIAPLAEPDLAAQYGVVPPRAVMLFGPPGTGKTTFARAIASRLHWPFVELHPSRLADGRSSLASALRSAFDAVAGLEHAVVFIDEVEEIAAHRRGDPPSPTQGVTNELLKLIPEFREQGGRLLICATNFVRSLDSAFLRHGRFDYVVPIGLPDDAARLAMWAHHVPATARTRIDLALLARRSDGLTPADIEYAGRRASQAALARRLGPSGDGVSDGPTEEDYLLALAATRATVSADTVAGFRSDIEAFARL
jgi:hypothetical protein